MNIKSVIMVMFLVVNFLLASEITLKNGEIIYGDIIKDGYKKLVVETNAGTVHIARNRIQGINSNRRRMNRNVLKSYQRFGVKNNHARKGGRKRNGGYFALDFPNNTNVKNLKKDQALFGFGIDFGKKINSNVDVAVDIGYVFRLKNDQKLSLVPINLNVKLFPLSAFATQTKTHGIFAPYLFAAIGYNAAFLESSFYSGVSMGGGIGLELAMGPQTVIFSEVAYRYLELTSDGSSTETLLGLVVKGGLRF
jgi:hypothetical protein